MSHLKWHKSSHISKYCSSDFFCHLVNILICHHQIELIFSSFWENRRKTIGCKVLELIDIEIKIFSLMLWNICSTHRVKLKLRHHHGSQQTRSIFSNFSLWEIYDNDFFIIHSPSHWKRIFWLTKHISQDRAWEELTNFIEYRSGCFTSLLRSEFAILMRPKFLDYGITDLFYDLISVYFTCEHERDRDQCRIWVLHQSKDSVFWVYARVLVPNYLKIFS